MAQVLVEGGEPERNLERCAKMVERAAEQSAELVLLPETVDLAWTHPSVFSEAEEIPGNRSDFFCKLAKTQKTWICVGLTEKYGSERYNTALLIDDQGKIVLKYRKINLLEVEFPYYSVGQTLSVVNTRFGRIGVNICADNYTESLCLGHSLARMGAQIILSPSSWTVDYFITEEDDPYKQKWIKPLSELATLYEIPVVSTTCVGYIVGGPYEGKKMVGKSIAVSKNGEVVEGEFNEFAGDLKVLDVELGTGNYKGTQFGKILREKGFFKNSN